MTPEQIQQLDELLKLARISSNNTQFKLSYSIARINLSEEYGVIV